MSYQLEDLQRAALRFRDERDWEQFHTPKDLVLGLGIEVAELAEHFLWKDAASSEEHLRDPERREEIADELADVQIFLFYLAHATGVHLGEAVQTKLERNAEKYPIGKARGSSRKYSEL